MFITQCSNLYQSLPASVIYSWGLMGGIGRSGRQSSEILERNILDSHSWFLAAFPVFVVIQECNGMSIVMQKLTIEQEDAEFLKIDRGVARISHHSKRSSVIVTEPIRETVPETPKTPKEGCLQWVRLWYHPTDESVVWKGSAPTAFHVLQTPWQTVTPPWSWNSFQIRRNKKTPLLMLVIGF